MKLDRFEYCYNRGLPDEWRVEDFHLQTINLIVGKNASGKSRIVNAIYSLAELLSTSGRLPQLPRSDEWHLVFDIDKPEHKTEYRLKIERGTVIEETLSIGSQELSIREKSGTGTILAEEIGQKIRFKISPQELAAVKRRDGIQHPFLEGLYRWSNSLRFYEFGSQLGKDAIAPIPTTLDIDLFKHQTDFKNYDYCTQIFIIGKTELGDRFTEAILSDMARIGYRISEIGTKVPASINSDVSLSGTSDYLPQFLYVKEEDLNHKTEQLEMSQGMFRSLSLLIQINYSLLATKPSCIVIDDIGEGLDYERSASLIKILIEKAKIGRVQLILTTNDEFIMNGVPLEYWSAIERKPGSAKLHNIFNSKDKFEQFQFIGLNNFDFFASDFVFQESVKSESE